jgi:hypothetical protein
MPFKIRTYIRNLTGRLETPRLIDGGLFVKIGAIRPFCNGINHFIEGTPVGFTNILSRLKVEGA